jgi:hypothetical protein
MSLAMNVVCQRSLPMYMAERKGRIIVQAPSLQKRDYKSRLNYNTYSPSTLFAFNFILRAYNYSLILIHSIH